MCIHFKITYANTKLHVFPLPYIAGLLDKLGKSKNSGSIYIATAYHYIRIAKGDMYKTAFLTNEGFYE